MSCLLSIMYDIHVCVNTLFNYDINVLKGPRTTDTLYRFKVRVSRAYTRAVMNRFEESMKYATAYIILKDTDGSDKDWIVQHTKRSNKIVWGQHQFKITADIEAGEYTCECKQWKHTGLYI
jgi:hypothetical protein